MSNTTRSAPAADAVGSQVDRGVGRLHPKRADVDALLADPSYYEPRIAKTPLPRVRLRQAVQQWDAMQARHEPPNANDQPPA